MSRLGFLDLCDLARAAITKGDLESGRKHFKEAIEIKPDSADAQYGLATTYYLARDYDRAIVHFKKVIEIDPLHAGAVINLGALCNVRGDYDQAVTYLRRGIQLDPKRSEGYYNLGIAYRKQGRYELAIQAYREAHHLNPRMVEAVFNLANVFFDMERYDQAVSHYRKALEINPGFRKAHEGLERALEKTKPKPGQTSDSQELRIPQATFSFEDSEKLDRLVHPDTDMDIMAEMHRQTDQARKYATHWLRLAEQLDESTRELGIGLTGKSESSDLREALSRFRSTINQFRECGTKFGEVVKSVTATRDKLIENA